MAAAPRPALLQQGGCLQEFGEKTLPRQMSIDSVRSIGSAATLDVPGHEARSMACSILADSEPVNSFPHVLPAEVRIAACDPLAFDDRMRIVIIETPEDLEQKNRNVSPPSGPTTIRSRTRLGSRQYDHPLVPRVLSCVHNLAHGRSQPFGDLHFVVARGDTGSGQPTVVNRPHDSDNDVRSKVDRGAEVSVGWGVRYGQVPAPKKLLATTALASSKARTPIH